MQRTAFDDIGLESKLLECIPDISRLILDS